jgi:pimeloyl-ACP methyl ester carboxylesterase
MKLEQRRTRRERPDWIEHGVSALNGWVGDYLAERSNGLQITMAFYHRNRPIKLTTKAILRVHPEPTHKLCILVHGLGHHEGIWTLSDPGAEFRDKSYGSLLQKDFGYTPLFLRYNTGLPISTNGKVLCRVISKLLRVYPVGVEELILIGHSMGGLVIRSACHYGTRTNAPWTPMVSRVFYLGSPHLGAPLEKGVNVLANIFDAAETTATRVLRDILNLRSRGIKDLRFGNLTDEDWLGYDPDELLRNNRRPIPWLPDVRHYRIAGALAIDRNHPANRIVGDGMVRVQSAKGFASIRHNLPPDGDKHFKLLPGLGHFELAHHPEVYAQIAHWCRGD